jgi:O-antigen ligase
VAQPALLVVAILLTGSRSILFLVAAALGLAVILGSPAQRLAGLAAVGPVLAAGTVAVALFPSLSERAATLTSLDALLGARRSLLEGAWRMFLDHPLFGMGAGGFSAGLLTDYSEFQSYYGAELNYSHTSLATIAAEQGLVGLALLAAWIVTMWVAARRARRWGPTFDVGTGAAVGLMLIFVASQSESRLFEDPYLWVLAGLLLGAARMARQAQRPVHPELEASGERD